jgi:membrane-bound ClpP family serine protease
MLNTLVINAKLDRVGMLVSCTCALHCLAMPLVLGLLPVLGASFLADELTENLLLLTAVSVGICSLLPGYFLHHRRKLPIALFSVGVLLVLAGRFGPEEGVWLETALSGLGAVVFAIAHFINYRRVK